MLPRSHLLLSPTAALVKVAFCPCVLTAHGVHAQPPQDPQSRRPPAGDPTRPDEVETARAASTPPWSQPGTRSYWYPAIAARALPNKSGQPPDPAGGHDHSGEKVQMSCRLCRHGPEMGWLLRKFVPYSGRPAAKRAHRPPMLIRLGRVADVVRSNQNGDPYGGKGNLLLQNGGGNAST